eukprot:20071-Heterococcus_DN1.PRE.2
MMMTAPPSLKAKAQQRKPGAASSGPGKPKLPELLDYVSNRDYTGALAVLEFNKRSGEDTTKLEDTLLWIGYCAFHVGRYQRALEAYEEVLQIGTSGGEVHLYLACCHFYLQMYDAAVESANKGPDCALKNRLLFHAAHKQVRAAEET